MTTDQPLVGVDLPSKSQLGGTECIDCGTAAGPLHPGETITTRVGPGVVQDATVVRCTPCVKARKCKPLAGAAAAR
ncbi:hypothetical protein P3T37_000044 [Kitasatospora sp. MAA4]|uniref:hypothetical protein n=1 Tax=Kitasatospora sp. MAA4 TaxID=3035093 RepID=UPI00247549E7|nr:hypothetical protein [Kitasatospora sp. MAA4]MDH6130677.1 hypothetical protein [Kitasatospora sp. MAA4]